jgi:hypothetical protein
LRFVTVTARLRHPFSRRLLEAAVIGVAAIGSLYATARIGLKPHDPASGVAIIFAPWTTSEQTLARSVDAGGRFVRYGGYPFIAVVVPEAPDYSSRIFSAGALFVVDPRALAACLTAIASQARAL